MDSFCVLVLILNVFVVGSICVLVSRSSRNDRIPKPPDLTTIDQAALGKYLVGLPGADESVAVWCYVTDDSFIFRQVTKVGLGFAEIPRDSINEIRLDTRSEMTQRLAVGRMLAFGVLSLAMPKKERIESFCLLIDWDDRQGTRQNAVFQFAGPYGSERANKAATTLKKYVKPKVARLGAGEKTCPYCAETIKREAIVCKHCGRELSSPS